jgi:hypothetical protein
MKKKEKLLLKLMSRQIKIIQGMVELWSLQASQDSACDISAAIPPAGLEEHPELAVLKPDPSLQEHYR